MHYITNLLNFNFLNHHKYRQVVLLFCLCFLFLLISVASLYFPLKKTLTYDEKFYYRTGLAILSGKPSELGEVDVDMRNIMPISALNPLLGESIPNQLISKLAKEETAKMEEYKVYFGKLATILVSLLLALYVFRWAHEFYGIRAAFFALILYLLDPNIIAHSRIVHQDILGAFSIFVATYYFWRFLKFGGHKNTILSVVTFGVAQVTRYTSIYLIPIYFILIIGFYYSTILNSFQTKNFKSIKSIVRSLGFYTVFLLITTILIINIGFSGEKTLTKFGEYKFESQALNSLQSSSPILNALPVPLPFAYVRGLDLGKYMQESGFGVGRSYLMGQIDFSKRGFKKYYLIAFLYKVPIATQLFLIMAVSTLIKSRNQINFWKNESFLVLPSIAFVIIFSLIGVQIGIRYIIMIFPFLFVLSSKIIANWTKSKNSYRVFIISLIGYLLFSNLSYYPHYLSYFNELLSDRRFGYEILADSNLSWGQNKKYLIDYLKKNNDTMYTSKSIDNFELSSERIFDYAHPRHGLVVIEANELVGILGNPKRFQWIRENLEPVTHISYNYLLFDIKPQDIPKINSDVEKEIDLSEK